MRSTNTALPRIFEIILFCAALANLVFLSRVAAAYLIALPSDLDSLRRAASILPYTSDSYSVDLSTQADLLLDSQGRFEEALPFFRASLARDRYFNSSWLLVALDEERLDHLAAAEEA